MTLIQITILVALLTACWTVAVALWASAFGRQFFLLPAARLPDSRLPRAAIVMGFKGADPFLLDSLRRLMTQDYPDYELRLVIDSRTDPAWSVAEQAVQETGAEHVRLEEFRDVPEHGIVNCTNAKVVQAIRGLDDSFDVVAMADGDTSASRDWLRELVSPLVTDSAIGVVTGHRWFQARPQQFGSRVRYVWNAAAVPIMYCLQMAWGGCYAIRTATIHDAGLLDKWSRIAALDMHTTREMRQRGLRIHFLPSLMVMNREECGLPFCLNFVRRQLTWARLYNPGWPLTVVHSVGSSLLLVFAVLLFLCGLITGNGAVCGLAVATGGGYVGAMAALVMFLEFCVRRRNDVRENSRTAFNARQFIRLAAAVPVTQAVQLVAVLLTSFAKRVAWRGAVLEICGPSEIRVVSTEDSSAPATGVQSL